MTVICVIGDLVGSRLVNDRMGLQRRLQASLDRINERAGDQLLSPCTITLGDEFQAVYGNAEGLFQDFLAILKDVYPEKVRFSVGIGSLSTDLNRVRAIGMDGPAFHIAREAMKSPFKRSDRLFQIRHAEEPAPLWIEAGLALVSHEFTTWKASRFLILERMLAGAEVKNIALEARISPTAVYKNIQSGGLNAICDMLNEVSKWINNKVLATILP